MLLFTKSSIIITIFCNMNFSSQQKIDFDFKEKTMEAVNHTEEILGNLVRELADELHPGRPERIPVNPDSSLSDDIGLDSLSRVELLSRVEKSFGVNIPERTFAEIETLRDLLQAVLAAGRSRAAPPPPAVEPVSPGEARQAPRDSQTLIDVLNWHVQTHPERAHILFYSDGGGGETLTYRQLREGAETVAFNLRHKGLSQGEPVAMMLPTERQFFFAFFGIILAGGVPVPLYPPARRSQMEDHLRRQSAILKNCGASMMIIMPEARRFGQVLKLQVETLRDLMTMGELTSGGGIFHETRPKSDDTAFLQYTSGSTGNPKGVIISHANLLENIRAMGEAVRASPDDVIVSWLPLYHDMGLIGTWMSSLHFACLLVLMSPFSFLSRPQRWLWAVHHYRGTISAAPNFAYELCLKRIKDDDLKGLDLSSWRIACNGAEPVSPNTAERFCERFSPYGFRPETFMPVYGLAESTVGLCFPPLGSGPVVDRIRRDTFMQSGQAVPVGEEDLNALRFVACGRPLPRHEIRIVDSAGRELPERYEGTLQFRGPSSTRGYFRNPGETKKLFRGDWLDSGDFAYLAEGNVYITGRKKDIIIRAGRNIYPQELEEAVSGLQGIRKGNVVVFGTTDPETQTEQMVVLAETREEDPAAIEALKNEINALAIDLTGMTADNIVLAKPGTVLKTSSGKIRRAANRDLYDSGRIGGRRFLSGWPVLHIILGAVFPELRRMRRAVSDFLYATYCRGLYCLLAPFTWLAVVLLPKSSWRWRVMKCAVRLLARATFTQIRVHGSENLPPELPCIYVANHASYLDSYVMAAVLPPEFSFVAKAELADSFLKRLPLNRIGTEYVKRGGRHKSVEDARNLSLAAQKGRSLFFFAEGTFTGTPGLLPFHMGAFLAAAESDLPVVPVAIRGTRNILPGNTCLPRRGVITVHIGQPINPSLINQDRAPDLWSKALVLRGLARDHILRHCGEPDLAGEKSPI